MSVSTWTRIYSRMCFLYNFYSIQFFSVQLFNEAAWSECNFNSSQYQKAFLQRSFSLSIQCVPVPSPVRVPLESGSCGSGRGGMLANIYQVSSSSSSLSFSYAPQVKTSDKLSSKLCSHLCKTKLDIRYKFTNFIQKAIC